MKLSMFKVLSNLEGPQIHDATVDILEHSGVQIGSHKMLSFLKGKGWKIDAEKQTACFSHLCIEDPLHHILFEEGHSITPVWFGVQMFIIHFMMSLIIIIEGIL